MKIRNGFVSNSSSSSYIIAFDNMSRSDLEKLFVTGDYSGDETRIDAVGVEDVVNHIKDWYGIGEIRDYLYGNEEENNEYCRDQFIRFAGLASKIVKAVDDGDNVALICVSYGDDISYDNLNSNGIKIVEDFG